MKIKYIRLFVLFSLLFLCTTGETYARKKKGKAAEATPTLTDYEKLFKDKPHSAESKGLINLHWVDDKVYLEIPKEVFNKRLLMGAVVDRLSNPQESSIGFCPTEPSQVKFCLADTIVRLYSLTNRPLSDQHSGIHEALKRSFCDVVLEQFPIKAYAPDSAVVIDATAFILKDEPAMHPIDPKGYNDMGGWVKRKATFKKERSMIADIASYPDNVSISCNMGYDISMSVLGIFNVAQDIPFSAIVKRIFMLLPEDGEYTPRIADPRIGTLWNEITEFSEKEQGSMTRYWANRWKLTDEKPIVFYVDTLLPPLWQECVYRSAAVWNKAFQEIGFPKALEVRPYPNKDATFDANSITRSCIRYAASPSQKITHNCWSDPYTGEMLCANVYIPHNLASEIQLNCFLQTSAFNEKARSLTPDTTLVKEVLTSMLLKQWGYCLGLTDNMAGSTAYPIDSLRNKEFVMQHGLSASVMDELPANYLLNEALYREGVPLTQQQLGEYDKWVIRYLYQPSGKTNYKEEIPALQALISERNQNPRLLYKRPQSTKAYYDPRGMKKDLGNDAIRSADIAFENMKTMIANANRWLDKEDVDYELRTTLYNHIINQADEYVIHVLQQVGGIYMNDSYAGESASYPSYQSVPKELQQKSFKWMLQTLEELSWMDEKELLNHCALTGSAADYAQKFFGNLVLIQLKGLWLSESKSKNPYTQQQALADLTDFLFKESRTGKQPSEIKLYLQEQLVNGVISWSDVQASKAKNKSAGSALQLTLQPHLDQLSMKAIESISYQSEPDREAFWYGSLLNLKQLYQGALSSAPTTRLKNLYRYRLFTIDKALRK